MTHTGYEVQPWWQVDLGAVQQISQVKVWRRTDCCYNEWYSTNFKVQVSNDPTFQTIGAEQSFSGAIGLPTIATLSGNWRYVRVRLQGTGYLMMGEVEVIGSGSAQPQLEWLVADHLEMPLRLPLIEDTFTLKVETLRYIL